MKRPAVWIVSIVAGALLVAGAGASAHTFSLVNSLGTHSSSVSADEASGARTESPEPEETPEASPTAEPTEKPEPAQNENEPAENENDNDNDDNDANEQEHEGQHHDGGGDHHDGGDDHGGDD
jgi:outer membrane biosynthesis protein TonB